MRFTNHHAMLALMPATTDWLYYFEAPPEADTPRIVHMITEGEWFPEHSQVEGRWDISVYSYGPTTGEARMIADTIKRKFANTVWFDTDGMDSVQLMLRPGAAFVGTGNYYIHRYDLSFTIRYSRKVQN